MDLLGRGWSPTKRQRFGLRLALGFLLVVNPAYFGVFNLDFSGQTYTVQPVTIEDGRITTADRNYPEEPFDGIGCSGWPITVGCALERARVHAGDLRYNLTVHHVTYDDQFFYHTRDGQPVYYRRIPQDSHPHPQNIVLERVEPRRVLHTVAVPRSEVSLPVRIALHTGRLQADTPPAEANRIIATNDGYVTLVETRVRRLSSGSAVETILSLLGVLGGLVLLRGAYLSLPTEW